MSALGITQWASSDGSSWQNAIEIACVAAAVRIVSESIGSMVMRCYTGDALDRQPVYDAPQAALFQDPAPGLGNGAQGYSSFDFWADLAACVEVSKAAFYWKVKDPRSNEVIELWPLDPDYFRIVSGQGSQGLQRIIYAWRNGKQVDVSADVGVIRAWAPKPGVEGFATPDMHRRTINWAYEYEEYRGRYFANDGTVNQVIENGPPTREERTNMARSWAAAYGGPRNKGKVGILWGQASMKQLGHNLVDAQAVDVAVSIAQDIARAWKIYPASMLYAESHPVRESTLEMIRGQLYTFTLLHRLRRIERALAADRDIFPDKAVYPRFDSSEFVRADTVVLGTLAHNAVQDGSMNRDESRALVFGLPMIPGGAGKVYVDNPVGAGPGHLGEGDPPPALPAATDGGTA